MQTMSPDTRLLLERLAEMGDREPPVAFAGRTDEINLLESAIRGVRRGANGRTVVVHGVPGIGKTSLRDEFAARLLAGSSDEDSPIVPVLLDASAMAFKPAAIVELMDEAFGSLRASGLWEQVTRRTSGVSHFLANAVIAAATRKDIRELAASSRAPDSLSVALADYARQRWGRKGSTIVLLVDESQNLRDTPDVRTHLAEIHNQGANSDTKMLLACFGLPGTVDRLAQLGLSRLSAGHARPLGVLSDEDARRVVRGTFEETLKAHTFDVGPFDEHARARWMEDAVSAIVKDSANFPHHLTNGCKALAEAVLEHGLDDRPPLNAALEKSAAYKREYYEGRFRPWAKYETAIAHAYEGADNGEAPTAKLLKALTMVSDMGTPTDEAVAKKVLSAICGAGLMDERDDVVHALLPSMVSHFEDVRRRRPDVRWSKRLEIQERATNMQGDFGH